MAVTGIKTNRILLVKAAVYSLALMTFAWFIPYRYPLKAVAFASLSVAAFLISINTKSIKQIIGTIPSPGRSLLFILSGILTGTALAFWYRNYLQWNLLPSSLQYFALTAAMIGITEELAFRGFLQGYTRIYGSTFSILFSTLSHAGYKCLLFISPAAQYNVNIGYLFLLTFAIGLALGISRHLTKSIIPAMTAHSVFDILVYGELVTAPWWVW